MLDVPNPPLESLPRFRVTNGGAFTPGSYSSGANWSVKVDRVDHLLTALLRVDGTITTGASASGATARVRNPIRIFGQTVKLKVNGKEELSARPDILLLRAQWRRGQFPLQTTAMTTSQVAASSVTVAFAQQLPLDCVLHQVLPSHIGVLLGAKTPEIELSGTYGTIGDLVLSPANHAVATANLSLVVDRTRMSLTREQASRGFGHYQISQIQQNVTSTGRLTVEIPGGRAYSAIYILAEAGSTAEPSDSVLTATGSFRVRRGSDILFEKPIVELKNDTVGGMPSGQVATGYYVADFLKLSPGEQAVISRAWITPGSQPLILEIDATTSTGANLVFGLEEIRDPVTSASDRYNTAR